MSLQELEEQRCSGHVQNTASWKPIALNLAPSRGRRDARQNHSTLNADVRDLSGRACAVGNVRPNLDVQRSDIAGRSETTAIAGQRSLGDIVTCRFEARVGQRYATPGDRITTDDIDKVGDGSAPRRGARELGVEWQPDRKPCREQQSACQGVHVQ